MKQKWSLSSNLGPIPKMWHYVYANIPKSKMKLVFKPGPIPKMWHVYNLKLLVQSISDEDTQPVIGRGTCGPHLSVCLWFKIGCFHETTIIINIINQNLGPNIPLAFAGIWGISQQIRDLSVSPSRFQIKVKKKLNGI